MQLKFARQTRITADLAYGQWTQNAAFLPYTINAAVFTPSGAPANAVSSLQRASLDGKIDTTDLISHRLPLEQAPEGYKNFKENQNEWTKVVLKPH